MSIIEKAVGRLERDGSSGKEARSDDKPSTVAVAGEQGSGNHVRREKSERAIARDAQPSSGRPRLNIPFETLHANGFLTPLIPRSTIAEEFRGIKRPILKNIAGRGASAIQHPNLVMVTSALQGDGKTFSSLNLAMSIAMEKDKTVLFVDSDVLKATAGSILGVQEGTPGLTDLLGDDQMDPRDVILHTNIDNLRVLPAGTPDPQATELLASEKMRDLMYELSARYHDRVIVFDSPPLLLTTEASVLASFMGQIVFVTAADITPQHAVTEALEHIGEDKMVGVMLNRASRRRLGLFGLGKVYGYGYGYGYGHREADVRSGDAS